MKFLKAKNLKINSKNLFTTTNLMTKLFFK